MAKSGDAGNIQQKIGDFAESLGSVLGAAEKEARSWLEQRKTIGQQLLNIRTTATRLLDELGLGDSGKAKRGRPKGAKGARRGAKRKRVVSEATKAKMRAAWAKRKAKKG